MQLAHRALKAFLDRDFIAAAELYGSAARLEPEVAEFAFGQARSLQERGLAVAATPIFARVVALTPPEHPLHAKAAAALLALQPPPAAVVILPAAPTPATVEAPPVLVAAPVAAVALEAPRVVAERAPAHSSWRRPAGFGALALGVAAAGLATGLAVSAANRQSALDSHQLADGRYDLTQVSYDTVIGEQRAINNRWTWATVAGSVGVTAVATAIWWLVTDRGAAPPNLAARGDRE